ncbi:helix-turn-helix transcriptional regulator [Alkalicoccus urumqiensis]|uniref:HTH luxR-type domain-containing protein n=1 Tax=Alkalicoccus urumqiensis TaxID=1548213 RepID=A0A2P6ML81_ALKUR|nr:LuxR C-terminal-related transcriptional regulator [Alkalicoccus urumqiensis]PRO67047.1 hypothetical protein C6I21_00325 [Alkalicoccus urumqiensis]
MGPAAEEKRRVLLVCREESYAHHFEGVAAPENVEFDFVTNDNEPYASTFDALFIFSCDPIGLIEEEERREHLIDWSTKKIVFITPAENLEASADILYTPVAGLVSLEKFLLYAGRAIEILADYPFLLEPELNYLLASEVKRKKQRLAPVERFLLQRERVDVPLRDAELNILQLLLDGRSTKEIADDLYYSVKTVKRYISNLIRVIGTTDRTGVVVHAIRNGWVEPYRSEHAAGIPVSAIKENM